MAERMFGPSIQEPESEKFKVEEFLDYALRERGCKGPQDLLDLISSMDRTATQRFPKLGMVDRLWKYVRGIRARKSMEAWLRAEDS